MYLGEPRARPFFEAVAMLCADLRNSIGEYFSLRFPGQQSQFH
jgi:hypothetical protein